MVHAANLDDVHAQKEIDAMMQSIKSILQGNRNVERAPNTAGARFVVRIGQWILNTFDDIRHSRLRIRSKYRPKPRPEQTDLMARKRGAPDTEIKEEGRLKRNRVDDPPRGPSGSGNYLNFRGDKYRPQAGTRPGTAVLPGYSKL